MARTPSTMLALGTPAPDFSLNDVVTGNTVALGDFAERKALLVMFISKHCPFVQHIKGELARLGRDYAGRDVGIVAISPNDIVNYPDDAPAALATLAGELGLHYPICYDESQAVAKSYQAACTPDFFLFDSARQLVYRGQLDGSRPGNEVANDGRDLRAALDAVLADRPVNAQQFASLGCNIKWRAGNEPPYFSSGQSAATP